MSPVYGADSTEHFLGTEKNLYSSCQALIVRCCNTATKDGQDLLVVNMVDDTTIFGAGTMTEQSVSPETTSDQAIPDSEYCAVHLQSRRVQKTVRRLLECAS